MTFDLSGKNYKWFMLVLSLGTLITRVVCFFAWTGVTEQDDRLLIPLTVVFYCLLAVTCFFGGKIKFAPRHTVSSVFGGTPADRLCSLYGVLWGLQIFSHLPLWRHTIHQQF